jgi:hypothetical protein
MSNTFLRDDATFAHISGTATNDDAAAGDVGEIVEADVAIGSEITITTTSTATNITSISLAAGDWDVSGVIHFQPAPTTTITAFSTSLSSTSAVSDVTKGRITLLAYAAAGTTTVNNRISVVVMPCRFSLSAPTTIFLVGIAVFGTSTMGAAGHIRARRMR